MSWLQILLIVYLARQRIEVLVIAPLISPRKDQVYSLNSGLIRTSYIRDDCLEKHLCLTQKEILIPRQSSRFIDTIFIIIHQTGLSCCYDSFPCWYHNLQYTLAILLTLIIAPFSSAMALLDILKLTSHWRSSFQNKLWMFLLT